MAGETIRGGAVRTTAVLAWLGAAMWLGPANSAYAISESFDIGNDQLKLVLNSTFTVGGGIRMQSPSENILAKGDINRNACGGVNGAFQSCQGTFKGEYFQAQQLVNSPGAASTNGDQGDVNYHRYRFFSAPAKLGSDLKLSYGDFGVFLRGLYFYDFVNNNFNETHPNELTPQNYIQAGRHVTPLGANVLNSLSPTLLVGCVGQLLANPLAVLSAPCPASQLLQDALINNRPYGQPDGHGNFVVYGPGAYVRSRRTDGEVLAQVGTNMQYLDSYFYGKLPIPFTEDKTLSFKIGRQLVNWGESTTLVINSINQANPVNANNFNRVGNLVEEDFVPINMFDISFEPIEGGTVEAFYQLEWKPVEAPAPGSYFSDLPIGTNDAGKTISASFGAAPLDPNSLGTPQDNPLAGITKTTLTIQRNPDILPRTQGQYGLKLDYYADWLNNGTDMSLYYMHYHSRLPYASFFATYPSCARKAGNGRDDATNTLQFALSDCSDIPLLHALLHPGANAPAQFATSDALPLDTARIALEYPQDINMIGASFNTTVGAWSIQGEVAYRPNLPLQVDEHDLAFAAFGPTLSNCMDPHSGTLGTGCTGSVGGFGYTPSGGTTFYPSSDFTPKSGAGFKDTFDLLIGALPGSARSFPNYIIPYRGGQLGDNQACYPQPGSTADIAYGFNKFSHPYFPYNTSSPCYIRGYERFQVYQFNFGATRVLGATDNPIGADQVLLLGELGATYVPYLPSYDRLVLQGPGVNYGPVAGADGSGGDGSRRACAGSADCSVGPDGLRFNPHQQDPSGFPDKLSWGYRVISIIRYENVLPGIGIQPTIIYSQDVGGTSPGPAGNFIAGRKQCNTLVETRYKSSLSFDLGYTWYWGGGVYNTLSDRDFAQFFVKYQF